MILRSPAGRPPPGGALRPNVALLGDDVILWSAEQRRVLWADGREVHATGEGSLTAVDQLALGAAARWGRVANAGVDFGTIQPLASDTGVTMLVIAAPSASANRKAMFSQRLGSGSAATYTLYANTSGAVSAASGHMMLYCRNTASTACPVTVTSSGIDGDPHCWVFANSTVASSGYALRDGDNLTTATNTAMTGTFVTSAQTVRVGNPAAYSTDGALAMDEPVYLVLAWPRYIPREEMRELSLLLFADPSLAYERVAVEGMVATGGGGTDLAHDNASHAHTADSLALTTSTALAIADAAHGHAAEQITLGTAGSAALIVADASHAHTAGAAPLSTASVLALADAQHAHAADAVALSVHSSLIVDQALHDHAAEMITLGVAGADTLSIGSAAHSHVAAALAITSASQLAVADALHSQAVDGLVLSAASVLALQDALHAHAADQPDLSDAPALLIADALHAHTSDGLALVVDAWLVIAHPAHAHQAAQLVLTIGSGQLVGTVGFIVHGSARSFVVNATEREFRVY